MLRKLKQHLSGAETGSHASPEGEPDWSTISSPTPRTEGHTPGEFISPQLHALATGHDAPSVTEAYAQRSAVEPGVSVEAVAEEIYGKRHHAHHEYKHTAPASATSGSVQAGVDARGDAKKEQEHLDKAIAEQWEAIHPLSPEQAAQVKQYGKWGTNEPSELFLNVSNFLLRGRQLNAR